MRRRLLSIAGLFLFLCGIAAQKGNVLLYKSFDDEIVNFDSITIKVKQSGINRDAFMPAYSSGIKGLALDLTDDVPVRIPVWLDKKETPDYSKSFSLGVWVQTKPGARQGTAILGNKKNYCPQLQSHAEARHVQDDYKNVDESLAPGWLLGTTDGGGWFFHACDGKNSYAYSPTVERQRINDGKWHFLAVSLDWEKKEAWFYFDGCNVAIYNVEELASVVSGFSTVIGGTDEYAEWGHHHSRGEWTAFNGKIDEVRFWEDIITPEVVKDEYLSFFPEKEKTDNTCSPDRLKIQVWNIWHGGRRFGQHVGLNRIVDVLKQENADIIGIVETYGSGAVIADSLQYYYYLISDNLSIMSRYPIDSTIQLYKSFRSGGVLLNLDDRRKVAFFDIWLDWRVDEYRSKDIQEIDDVLSVYAAKSDEIPVFVVGDFNSGSHLDSWSRINTSPNIFWPSKVMEEMGFKDSFREINVDSNLHPGYTWSPLISKTSGDQSRLNRVDFIYYKGRNLNLFRSIMTEHHPVFWPSDHASVISCFYVK